MAKIKKVRIENFRAYEGSHDFSFMGKNGLANLVVVYGPNGYGKTSFFDAVEWAFSNKIRRFENGVLKQELESKDFASDDQIILTNRSGYYKGGKGEVTIFTDEDKIIKRTVVPRQIPNTEIKNDYRDVQLLGNYSQAEINRFAEHNMLTQDQIDSFLRFKTPEEKFEALREFWPEGGDASTAFSSLSSYSRILKTQFTSLQHRINDIMSKIDDNINSDANFAKIDSWINEFNKEIITNIKFPLISREIDDEVYKGIIQSNETYKLIVDSQVTTTGNMVLRLNMLDNSHKLYSSQLTDRSTLQRRLAKLQETVSSLEKIRLLREDNIARAPQLNSLSTKQTNLQRAISLWPGYIENKLQIHELQADTYRRLEDIDIKTGEKSFLEDEIRTISAERTRLAEEFNREQTIATKIEVNLRQIEKLRNDILEGINHQQFSESCIAEIFAAGEPAYQQRQQFLEILNSEEYTGFEPVDLVVSEHIRLLPILRERCWDISIEIEGMKLEMERKGTFSENLSRLVKWASQQVAEQHLSTCPMCKTDFGDVEHLLTAITADKGDLLLVSELEQKTEEFSLIMSYLQEELLESESFLFHYISDQNAKVNLEIVQSEKTIAEFEGAIRKSQHSIEHATIAIGQLFEEIALNENLDNLDLEVLRLNNKDNIAAILAQTTSEDGRLRTKSNDLKLLSNSLLVLQNTVANNGNKINLIQAKETFIECTELLEQRLQLISKSIDLRFLEQQLKDASALIASEQQLIAVQNQSITKLEKELWDSVNTMSEVEHKEQMSDLDRQLGKLKVEIANFEASYRALIAKEEVSLSSIQDELLRHENLHAKLTELRARLDTFGIDLAVIEGDVVRNGLKTELSLITADQQKIQKALDRIDSSKEMVGAFITKGIDEYFNKDVINQIYGKIEPHPKLTEIDIRAESTGKLPRLTIRAKSDSEELAPGLFLSTGQVNVLSLSIFIARAYEMGNGNFNSIFMDDPVQNMSDINVLSFVDLLRILIMDQDKQVMISTHDEKFFRLLKNKLPAEFFKSKFIELASYGTLKEELNTNETT
ncbi:AAA family ATPase [Pedobacter sp. KBW06]|uniref:AAA family ATPase n=1 Tax=Pedobacter sp. KBW06 TaxID=2153359 RepID=UPI0013158B71|nr:AAA family ATPase [Pedobacter sp. KBW06]